MPVHVYRLRQKALRTFDTTFALDSGRLLEEGCVFRFLRFLYSPGPTTQQHHNMTQIKVFGETLGQTLSSFERVVVRVEVFTKQYR